MSRRKSVTTAVAPLLGVLAAAFAAPVNGQDDLAALRNQMAEQRALIQAQQRRLEQQAQELERLSQRLESMAASKGGAAVVAADSATRSPARSDDATTGSPVVSASAGDAASPGASDGQQAAVAELQRREVEGTADVPVNAQATLYDPSSSIFDPNFPGAWHLPGTTAAMKIGGYVNLAVIDSLDPIASSDGFVVGTIPPDGVDVPDASDGTQVTAGQSA